jgi:hypothetical protein
VFLSPSFPFSLVHVVAFAFMGLFALLQALAGFFSPYVMSRENRLTLTFGVYTVMSLLIVLVQQCPISPAIPSLAHANGNESDLVNVFTL